MVASFERTESTKNSVQHRTKLHDDIGNGVVDWCDAIYQRIGGLGLFKGVWEFRIGMGPRPTNYVVLIAACACDSSRH